MRFTDKELSKIIEDFLTHSVSELKNTYSLKDTSGWSAKKAKESLNTEYKKATILYRPFDLRKSILQDSSGGFIGRSRYKTSKHFLLENIGLITVRQQSTFDFQHILVTKNMIESGAISLQTKEWGYIFPLYLYAEDGTKVPNLNHAILEQIEKITGKTEPEEILDYIYAVLHSPTFREKYKEFLKIDFPRVPYPKDKTTFKKLVKLGTELRQIHLLESPKVNKFITTFPNMGSDIVEKPIFKTVGDDYYRPNNYRTNNYRTNNYRTNNVEIENIRPQQNSGDVWINDEQYFGNVPEIAWNFYIGGYQPAQKWLKDRKGRTLTNEEIEHYQKIIVALSETDRIMNEIENIDFQ